MLPASSVFHPDRMYSKVASFANAASDAIHAVPTEQAKKDEKLAAAIKAGMCSQKDWDDLNQIFADEASKERFFSNSNVQRKLVKALMMGTYLPKEIIDELAKCTPCISADEQQKLFDQKFAWMIDTLHSQVVSVNALRFFTALTPDRQNKLVDTFEKMPAKTASDYKGLAWDEKGAATLATTFNGRIKYALARNLSILSDSDAQKTVARILSKKVLGFPINLKNAANSMIGQNANQVQPQNLSLFPVLDAAIKNLHHLADPEAQKIIVQAIVDTIADKKLGVGKLVEVANNITTFSTEVQQPVINAISASIFAGNNTSTDDVAARQTVITNANAALSALTNPEAKKEVVQHVVDNVAKYKDEKEVQSFFVKVAQDGLLDDVSLIKNVSAVDKDVFAVDEEEVSWSSLAASAIGIAAVYGIQYWIFG